VIDLFAPSLRLTTGHGVIANRNRLQPITVF